METAGNLAYNIDSASLQMRRIYSCIKVPPREEQAITFVLRIISTCTYQKYTNFTQQSIVYKTVCTFTLEQGNYSFERLQSDRGSVWTRTLTKRPLPLRNFFLVLWLVDRMVRILCENGQFIRYVCMYLVLLNVLASKY